MTRQTPPPNSSFEASAPILEMRDVSKSYPGVRVLDGVSLSLRPGEVQALMGENGAGKSTLMKILAGAVPADSGQILLGGQPVEIDTPQNAMALGIGIIYQELNLAPHLSIAENIFLGREPRLFPGWIDGAKMRREARALMENLGMRLDVRTLVGQLSVAQRQMVEIAKATSRQVRVLAMDEPSATLTAHELQNLWRLIRHLQTQGIGIIYISHRMDEVFQIADTVTVLRDGKMVGTSPVEEISRDDVLRLMVGRALDETYPKLDVPPGRKLLEVRGLSRPGVLEDITFTVHAGEVVALAGLFFGLAGALQFGRLGQGDPTVDVGAELDVIAAVVIGGGSLSGGEGSVLGSLLGALIMALLRNGSQQMGWSAYVQQIIIGLVIIAAVAADRLRHRNAAH